MRQHVIVKSGKRDLVEDAHVAACTIQGMLLPAPSKASCCLHHPRHLAACTIQGIPSWARIIVVTGLKTVGLLLASATSAKPRAARPNVSSELAIEHTPALFSKSTVPAHRPSFYRPAWYLPAAEIMREVFSAYMLKGCSKASCHGSPFLKPHAPAALQAACGDSD
eukprot:350211-Chlamydomonas_euryale.AAC.3